MKRILVVDDEPEIEKVLATFLKGNGFDVITAGGGREALRIIESGEKIDLMVLDLKMPEISGVDVLRKMRDDGINLKTIVLSGSIDVHGCQEGLWELGFKQEEILNKPVSLRILLEEINKRI